MLTVAVGSQNPVKVAAAKEAFEAIFATQTDVWGEKVVVAVPEQPLDEATTLTGARARAEQVSLQCPSAQYWVGMEGGLSHANGMWMECGWIVVWSRGKGEGVGATGKIMIPDHAVKSMSAGETLNDVVERHWGIAGVGAAQGYYGIATNGALNRQSAYRDGCIMALARFIHPDFFKGG